METKDIDKTHIVTLQEENGLFQTIVVPITRPDLFFAEFNAMKANPNRTVWDMQSLFTAQFPKTTSYLEYIHPYSYSTSYVQGVSYPKMFEYDELQKSWSEAGNAARQSYLAECKQHDANCDITIAAQKEKTAIGELKKRQKEDFYDNTMRWIDARCYYNTANQLRKNSMIKMFSKEYIGWIDFTHRINDDINVELKTNFGFGCSSYFLLSVQYKGINILPYSYIVKYYKAYMADIVRCTRMYSPCRESWSASFDFISEFVNKSIADPDGFVKSYIIHEVTEMMQGLEAIATNPRSVIEGVSGRRADPCVINVRPIYSEEKIQMQVYPEETQILFKVEKIVGALDFLNNLKAIAKEVDTIRQYIDRLQEINMTLYPQIQDAIAKIGRKVKKQTSIKENLENKISDLSKRLTPFETEIERLRTEATQEKPFVMNDYEDAHPEYIKIKSDKSDLQSGINKVNKMISDFNSFLKILNMSLSRLDEVKSARNAS